MAAKTEFEQWIANEYSFVHPNMVAILKPCWEAATKAAEARFTSHNTGSPKSAPDIVESDEACDYCQHCNSEDSGTCWACYDYNRFKGRRLLAGA
jgi:hypothetical protein